jgi:NAD(P)-dependent dehydrogenase (short-subunit alcohol dehydrogenase family)
MGVICAAAAPRLSSGPFFPPPSRSLAECGAEVILACRSAPRGAAAVEKLLARCGGKARVSAMPLDLGSFASIEAFAAAFRSQHARLDILMNNAGVMALPQLELTADGLERQVPPGRYMHHKL